MINIYTVNEHFNGDDQIFLYKKDGTQICPFEKVTDIKYKASIPNFDMFKSSTGVIENGLIKKKIEEDFIEICDIDLKTYDRSLSKQYCLTPSFISTNLIKNPTKSAFTIEDIKKATSSEDPEFWYHKLLFTGGFTKGKSTYSVSDKGAQFGGIIIKVQTQPGAQIDVFEDSGYYYDYEVDTTKVYPSRGTTKNKQYRPNGVGSFNKPAVLSVKMPNPVGKDPHVYISLPMVKTFINYEIKYTYDESNGDRYESREHGTRTCYTSYKIVTRNYRGEEYTRIFTFPHSSPDDKALGVEELGFDISTEVRKTSRSVYLIAANN